MDLTAAISVATDVITNFQALNTVMLLGLGLGITAIAVSLVRR